MILLYVLGAFVGIIIIYLAIILFWPRIRVPKQPLPGGKSGVFEQRERPPSSRNNISFRVGGLDVKGWFYLPENLSVPIPCIIMNHGFGGTKDLILENYALRYQAAGMAVFTFDYRHFGESDGLPRQLFSIESKLEDCMAAIEFARKQSEIDADKIATILGDRAKVIRYPIGHFDIYTGDHFERAASDQIDFFKKHLSTKTQRKSTNYSNC
jgi:fermentation-respiration switch protein FrsA (DUF1100 family)